MHTYRGKYTWKQLWDCISVGTLYVYIYVVRSLYFKSHTQCIIDYSSNY